MSVRDKDRAISVRSGYVRLRSGHGQVRRRQDRSVQGLVSSGEFKLWQLRSSQDQDKSDQVKS